MLISGLYMIAFMSVIGIFAIYKANDNNYKKIRTWWVIFSVSLLVGFVFGVHFDNGREYEITLINQNKVKIQAMDSGRIYYCAPEKITETIDKDNL